MQRSIIIDADGEKGASECYAVVLLVIDISNWSQKKTNIICILPSNYPRMPVKYFNVLMIHIIGSLFL